MDVDSENKQKKARTSVDIGALLVESREKKHLSAQDIASKMNLTLSVISKIEENQFEQDIPLAFIRGYIRSYAQIVGADAETLCVEFDRQTSNGDEPVQKIQVVSSFKSSRKEINSSSLLFKLITYLIVFSLIALGGWEAWKRFGPNMMKAGEPTLNEIPLNSSSNGATETDKVKTDAAKTDTVRTDTVKTDETTQLTEVENLEGSSKQDSQVQPVDRHDEVMKKVESSASISSISNSSNDEKRFKESVHETSAGTDIDAGTEAESPKINEQEITSDEDALESKPMITGPVVTANFSFSGDCWVQVTDANGEILAVGVKHDGKNMPLKGVAPLSVILGEPSVVTLIFNGDNYDLSRFRAGRTAQFVLE